MIVLSNFIRGRFVEPESGAMLENVDPATGAVYGQLPDSGESDVDLAVEAAEAAFSAWSATPAAVRSRLLLRIASFIERDVDRLAHAECLDTGKPLRLARSLDIPRAAANFRFFATAILHTKTEAHLTDDRAINITRRDPIGVCGLISPWNLPLYLLSWKIAPALAAGNTAVAKPSEVTPVTAQLLAELCDEAGLPPGVLNIVHGRGAGAGAALVRHPSVKAISFTGGTATGAAIAAVAAPVFKKLSLELGGKNPNLVFADADLERALATGVRAAFSNQGQICLCASRFLVQRPIYDRFVQAFVEMVRKLRVGDPLDEHTDQGALISAAHLAKVEAAIARARDEGGTILCGGERPRELPERCRGGFFLQPTVVSGLDQHCRTNQEEIFGPVVTIAPFDDESEALAMANATPYGLSSTVWTSDLDRAHRVAHGLQTGTVWINTWLLRDLRVPFGGMKQSGIGREGGEEAMHFFTEPKNVCVATEAAPSSADTAPAWEGMGARTSGAATERRPTAPAAARPGSER